MRVIVFLLAFLGSALAQDATGSRTTATVPASSPAVSAILPAQTNITTGILLPNPIRPTCEVGITMHITNSSFALADERQPTVSPVPSIVLGNLSLAFANLNVSTLKSYVVTLQVPVGVLLSNFSSGNPQQQRIGPNGTVAYDIIVNETLAAAGQDTNVMNISVTASSQDFIPRIITVNGAACALGLTPNVTAKPEQFVQSTSTPRAFTSFAVQGAVGTDGIGLVGVDGQPLTLRGANWFGFETGANMVDGLFWDDTLRGDLATVTYRIQLLGFNAVRIPFSFLVLFQQTATNYQRNCYISTQDAIRANVIDPRDAPNIPSNSQPPNIVAPPNTYGRSGVCNDYVPQNSVFTRFLYVIGYFARQGLYILIDNHSNTDPTVVNNPATWVAQWTQVMTSINQDPVARGRVMVDILNEPDSRGLTWSNMNTLYLQAMDAIYQVNPNTLFFIEGVGMQYPIMMCWGDGFVTDAGLIAQYGLSDPRPFFDALLTRPYLNNVVISPHYYGPSISGATDRYTGTALAQRMTQSFGYLNQAGYRGHRFPIVIGETGSFFTQQQAADLAFFRDFALYLQNQGYMNDGLHQPITSLFWWSWNANSGDTGGLVDSDWNIPEWQKIEYLESTIGLVPWSLSAAQQSTQTPAPTTPAPTQTPAPTTPAPTQTPAPTTPTPTQTPAPTTPTPTQTPAPTTPAPTQTPSPAITTPAPTVMSTPAPTPQSTPAPATPAPTAPSGAGSCSVTYRVGNMWQDGSGNSFAVIDFGPQSTSSSAIPVPYSIVTSNPRYVSLTTTWNWQATLANGQISGATDPSNGWETLLPNRGNQPDLGVILQLSSESTADNIGPTQFTLNGVQCQITRG